jgi:hypothetical protein
VLLAHRVDVAVKEFALRLRVLPEETREYFAVDDKDVAVREGHGVTGPPLLVNDAEEAERRAGFLDAVRELTPVGGHKAVLDDAVDYDKHIARHVVDVVDYLASTVRALAHGRSNLVHLLGAGSSEEGKLGQDPEFLTRQVVNGKHGIKPRRGGNGKSGSAMPRSEAIIGVKRTRVLDI